MMKNKILLLIVILFCTSVSMKAGMLEDAARAYESGDYAKCIDLYERVAKEKGVSAALLSNLGNAYVKCGDYGRAMVCYERSLQIDPSDREVRGNIAYVESKVEDSNRADAKGSKISVSPESKAFFSNLKGFIVYRHTSNEWAVWAAAFFVMLCIFISLYFFAKNVLARKIGFFGGFITLCFSIIFLVFSFMAASALEKHDRGVIVAYKVNFYSESLLTWKSNPNSLNRGTLVDILSEEEDGSGKGKWFKVRLNSDYVGWVKSSDLEVI